MNYNNTSLAYDLSRFDMSGREQREEQRKKDAEARKIRMAPQLSVSKSGSKLLVLATAVVVFGALFAVNYYNAKNDDAARMVSKQQAVLAAAQEDNALLQSKLDSKVNIGYIEKYATETLGMTKVGAQQKRYISVNTESLIETAPDDSKGFLGSIKKGFGDFLEYIGF
ncbi:MAG: hypothetical protein K2N06_03000 [Oscillospiraceae bacterium]|nr:hypothetical protein [Oscillospiraceae bacterium]